MLSRASRTGAVLAAEQTTLPWPIVIAVMGIVLGASLFTHSPYHNTDVSWLITVSEKVMAGKILYKDVLETNPPGAVLLYLPATFLANSLGLRPEDLVTLQTYLVGLLSLATSYRILPNEIGGLRNIRRPFLLLGAFNLFVLPMDAFAQREHFAAMLSLPMVCAFVRFSETGTWPSFWFRAASVPLAAVMLTIKPYFALPGLFVVLYAMLRARSWRPLLDSGMLAAGLTGLALTLILLGAFPHYISDMLPVLRDVYVPARSDLMALLLTDQVLIATLLALLICILLAATKLPLPGVDIIFFLASTGFLSGYIIQGKGFPYHAYPAVLYASLGFCLLAKRRFRDALAGDGALAVATGATLVLAAVAILGLAAFGLTLKRSPMTNLSWSTALRKPSIMAITKEFSVAFPLVRRIGADWVDSSNSQWVAHYTRFMIENRTVGGDRRRILDAYHLRDIGSVISTVQREKPEIVLVDASANQDWLRREVFAACPGLLRGYRPIALDKSILVMQRTSSAGYVCGR